MAWEVQVGHQEKLLLQESSEALRQRWGGHS